MDAVIGIVEGIVVSDSLCSSLNNGGMSCDSGNVAAGGAAAAGADSRHVESARGEGGGDG